MGQIMSAIKDQRIEDSMSFDDTDYGYVRQRNMEILESQISLWKLKRDVEQTVMDEQEEVLDRIDARINKLDAQRMMIKAEIDAEKEGHPQDE